MVDVAKDFFSLECVYIETTRKDLMMNLQSDFEDKAIMVIRSRETCLTAQQPWHTPNHAYTIVNIEGSTMEIRNPWASTPTPFKASLQEVADCMDFVINCK